MKENIMLRHLIEKYNRYSRNKALAWEDSCESGKDLDLYYWNNTVVHVLKEELDFLAHELGIEIKYIEKEGVYCRECKRVYKYNVASYEAER